MSIAWKANETLCYRGVDLLWVLWTNNGNEADPPDGSWDGEGTTAMADAAFSAAMSAATSAASAAITAIATAHGNHDDPMDVDLTSTAISTTSSSKWKHIDLDSTTLSSLPSSSLVLSDASSKKSKRTTPSSNLSSSRPSSSNPTSTSYRSKGSSSKADKVTPTVAIMGLNHSIH